MSSKYNCDNPTAAQIEEIFKVAKSLNYDVSKYTMPDLCRELNVASVKNVTDIRTSKPYQKKRNIPWPKRQAIKEEWLPFKKAMESKKEYLDRETTWFKSEIAAVESKEMPVIAEEIRFCRCMLHQAVDQLFRGEEKLNPYGLCVSGVGGKGDDPVAVAMRSRLSVQCRSGICSKLAHYEKMPTEYLYAAAKLAGKKFRDFNLLPSFSDFLNNAEKWRDWLLSRLLLYNSLLSKCSEI